MFGNFNVSSKLYFNELFVRMFGITCVECLTAEKPFKELRNTEVILAFSKQSLSIRLDPSWPPPLKKLLSDCVLYDPDDRPNMREVNFSTLAAEP